VGPRFALQTCAALLAEYQAVAGAHTLSPDEQSRVESITSATRRQQFLAGRWLARTLLCETFGSMPAGWRISADPQRKPCVLNHFAHISIAHSGDYVACALADEAVGIDLERISVRRPVVDMAQWVCSVEEQHVLAALNGDGVHVQFTRMWTRKEARLKQSGLPFDTAALRNIRTMPADLCTADGGTWTFVQQGVVVSLAAHGLEHLHTGWPAHWIADPVQWHHYL
jgi:4'-phosphopantetheinyl transferase